MNASDVRNKKSINKEVAEFIDSEQLTSYYGPYGCSTKGISVKRLLGVYLFWPSLFESQRY